MMKDLGEGTTEDNTKIEEACEDWAREKIKQGRRSLPLQTHSSMRSSM